MTDEALVAPRSEAGTAFAGVVMAWRSLRPLELGWFVLLGLGYGLTDLGSLIDLPAAASPWPSVARLMVVPLLASLALLPFWLLAARHPASGAVRTRRLLGAALAGALLGMALLWPLVRWMQWPTVGEVLRQAKGQPMFAQWHWGVYASDVLTVFLPAALAFLLFDLVHRRRASTQRLRQLQAEQQCLSREVLAARLAALQAQLEPQFLFDTLVDIERAYAGREVGAPERLVALIHHLRVALPRLREGSTTLASEGELLASWLAVAAHGMPVPATLASSWEPALAATPLPPMLLLPLLQAALPTAQQAARQAAADGPAEPPPVGLHARRAGGSVEVTLTLARPGLCPPLDALQALAARAQAVWWCPLSLDCHSDDESTRFVLRLACEPGCG